MSKVLIVDDEIYVCELVRHLIHWEALGLQLAGIAHSADEAVGLIRRQRPEIIISDIKMPGCDGFDLIELARELVPDCNFILISGHKNFQYAHEALKLSVRDYILKPINGDELNNTLQKLSDELHLRRQQRSQPAAITSRLAQDRQKLEDCFLRDVAAGRPPQSAAQAAQAYSLQLGGDTSAFWLLHVDTGKKDLHRSSPYMLYQKLQGQCRALLAGVCSRVVVSIRHSGLVLFLNYPHEQAGEAARAAGSLMTLALDTISAFADSTATLGIGLPFGELPDSCASYESARLCVCARVRLGSGRVLRAQDYTHLPADPSAILTPAMQQSFANAVDTLNGTLCRSIVERCFAQACGEGLHPALPYLLCERLLADLEHTTHLELPDAGSLFGSARSYLDYAANTGELRQVVLQTIDEVLQHNLTLRSKRGKETIAAAKNYVAAHYSEPIRLETVAKEVFLSPSYFSTLFKKETSESFVDYVTAYRIEQAKQLLRSTNASVAEVGSAVGISDGRYFSRLFTRAVGLKPSVYRRLYH